MNGNFCMTRVLRLLLVLIPVLIGLVFLPADGNARSKDDKNACRQAVQCNVCGQGLQVTMEELEKHPEDYYGKTVTVTGEMHRIFTDNVFTIEDSGFLRDHDILIISTAPREQVLTPVEDSIDPGKDVTVTGVVQPYDRGKLECAYGPLNLESREGHSFTKNPVIIVDRPKTAMVVDMTLEKPVPEPVISAPESQPVPEPQPAPEPPAIAQPAPEPPAAAEPAPAPAPVEEQQPSLPRTASNLPVLLLVGLLALSGALIRSEA